MKIKSVRAGRRANAMRKARHVFAAAATILLSAGPATAEIAQTPLYLGGGNVPGNLLLVPSVEWPTIVSVANLGEYDPRLTYVGYFDAGKCYEYEGAEVEEDEHFKPVGPAVGHLCNDRWSGNFMNWAATQTVDPFRKVLTGGYRVLDTPSETWLEKARHTGQGGDDIYPTRSLGSRLLVNGATPFEADSIDIQIDGFGNQMRLTMEENGDGDDIQDVYDFRVRVAVCVAGMLEPNCRKYSDGYKPEGLIQKYADELRIGVFGYLNDPAGARDGGVLRAQQGYVGPTMIVPGSGETANPNAEWDPVTGVFYDNPDPVDAAATASALGIPIANSGAINYLNKFGQLTSNNHKSYDPVSELYYTALRYLKNQGNVPEYTAIPGDTAIDAARATDGFPVITDWDDPIQYACQKNVILGIGDVYTHRDKNLPGSSYGTNEPATPAAVSSDSTVDVVKATSEVASMEGIGIVIPFSGRENSAFIAGLAWDAHVRDMRTDLAGDQTVATHWVDVLEAQSLEPKTENQYYLAAKYGGFRVPEDFDPDTHTGGLDLEWWHSNGETLTPFGTGSGGASFPRPDNYYLAGEAYQMVESLTEAFARISAELRSSASSVAANSTRLGSDTAVFQAAFDSHNWSGELQAFRINMDGTINTVADWSAAASLDAKTESEIGNRKIFTVTPPVDADGDSLVSTTGVDFEWANLSTTQQEFLLEDPDGSPVDATVGQARLDYLRGSREGELPDGSFRKRDSRLGDIVNSDPQFVHQQDFGYTLLDQSEAFFDMSVGADYQVFRESTDYLDRAAMVVVGSNDGMLHGFNASLDSSGGEELFAFVPNAVYENLYELTLPEYEHLFFVDGSPRVADVWYGSTRGWGTIAVGTTGAGGKSVFALDVTDPGTMSAADVLWEFKHPSMGYTIGQAAVAPLPNGKFGVVVTSGYATGQDDGVIWILNPTDGSIMHEITVTGSGDLGAPLLADLNSDRVADRIYVGDTDGNLWRFDLDGDTTSNWRAPNGLRSGSGPQPLFVATDANGVRQAITAPLSSAFNEDGLHTVFFGTGSFYRINDNVVPETPAVDTFYAITDQGQAVSGRSALLEQSIIYEGVSQGTPVRGISANMMQADDHGWYLDLVSPLNGAEGERIVSRATVRGDRVIFATLIPNPDPCAFGGESWIMELNTFSGGRLKYSVFDLNDDANFDDGDTATFTDGAGNEITIPVSGIKPGVNIVKTPAIIAGVGENQDEVKVMSGSSGELVRVSERGSVGIGRQSWRQMR